MMFLVAQEAPVVFLCLTAEDEMKLRQGNTLYVDPRMTGGRFFNHVILSLHKTKEDIVRMLRSVRPDATIPDHLPEPPAAPGEIKCEGCSASSRPETLFERRCIICWSSEAKRLRTQSN